MAAEPQSTGYCCEEMTRWSQPCDEHKHNPMDCPDRLIHHTTKTNMPGIRIFDGGNAFAVISFCPWCGKQIFDHSGLGGFRVRGVTSE